MPEISVIMGIYNANKKQAAQAIDSILKQTLTDFEFIICDDGSKEFFFQWLRKYCKKDSRIVLLRNRKNRGLAVPLNHCLSCASGTYIARMDADDCSHRRRLEKQAAFLQQFPVSDKYRCGSSFWLERLMQPIFQHSNVASATPYTNCGTLCSFPEIGKDNG